MTIFALALGSSTIATLLVAAVAIWLIFYVLPLPPMLRTVFAVVIAVALILMLVGCAGLPQRTYSLQYSDQQGRTIGGGVTLGDTRGLAK